MKKLLIKADDFGFTNAISLAILLAHKNGIVKNTGMMVNMPAAPQASKWISLAPDLCLGLHVNLVVGKPCADPSKIPGLIQENGNFISSKTRREQLALGIDPFDKNEVLIEIEAQVNRFIELNHCNPEYIETHAIMSQSIQDCISIVAKKFKIAFLPHHHPNIWSIPQFENDHYAFYKTEKPYHEYFENLLNTDSNLVLFVCHPGFVDQEIIRYSSLTIDRTLDYEMMIDLSVINTIHKMGYEVISFRDIK